MAKGERNAPSLLGHFRLQVTEACSSISVFVLRKEGASAEYGVTSWYPGMVVYLKAWAQEARLPSFSVSGLSLSLSSIFTLLQLAPPPPVCPCPWKFLSFHVYVYSIQGTILQCVVISQPQFLIFQRASDLPNFGCPITVTHIRVMGSYGVDWSWPGEHIPMNGSRTDIPNMSFSHM